MSVISELINTLKEVRPIQIFGRVSAITGNTIEVQGIETYLLVGSRCRISTPLKSILAEVVGFNANRTILMPFDPIEGIGLGNHVELIEEHPVIHPDHSWLGRVINALGEPIDNKGPLFQGLDTLWIRQTPLPAHTRQRVGPRLDLGIRAINTFITTCIGQRLGIFSGSGVGKSILLSMISKFTKADINIIGLIGERGREVQEFLQTNLSSESLSKSIIIVATSDETAMRRKTAAYITLTLAEYFRNQGKNVLCLMDSVTRFAMAQREIGLAAGEPPTSKGYTPTVFSELPKLLERAGPGQKDQGHITGIFTVLVEGDDTNEPISDAVRGILDGHIIMERSIAEQGRYPPINILKSISRTMPFCNSETEQEYISRAKRLWSTYTDMEEMIRLGAYRKGSNPQVDEAITYHAALEDFLKQHPNESSTFEQGFKKLKEILDKS